MKNILIKCKLCDNTLVDHPVIPNTMHCKMCTILDSLEIVGEGKSHSQYYISYPYKNDYLLEEFFLLWKNHVIHLIYDENQVYVELGHDQNDKKITLPLCSYDKVISKLNNLVAFL
jgi:hypothetical protein